MRRRPLLFGAPPSTRHLAFEADRNSFVPAFILHKKMPGREHIDVGGVKRELITNLMQAVLHPANRMFRKQWWKGLPIFYCEGCTAQEIVAYEGLGALMGFQLFNKVLRNPSEGDVETQQEFFLGSVFPEGVASGLVFRALFLPELGEDVADKAEDSLAKTKTSSTGMESDGGGPEDGLDRVPEEGGASFGLLVRAICRLLVLDDVSVTPLAKAERFVLLQEGHFDAALLDHLPTAEAL